MAVDIARAWKDPEYRKTLTPAELASLPPNPAGNPELLSKDLDKVSGGMQAFESERVGTLECCTGPESCPTENNCA
jgi:mersacidin/lichenicidin family type 2 lantibiotic